MRFVHSLYVRAAIVLRKITTTCFNFMSSQVHHINALDDCKAKTKQIARKTMEP